MENKKSTVIFVTGFLGSDYKGLAKELAQKYEYQILDLNDEIEKADGRSVQRICMIMGEHEYRNKEYEILCKMADMERIVVICGDGTMLDDMNREILQAHTVKVADLDADPEYLWERAKEQKDLPYAFMYGTDEALKKKKFMELYEQRKPMFQELIN